MGNKWWMKVQGFDSSSGNTRKHWNGFCFGLKVRDSLSWVKLLWYACWSSGYFDIFFPMKGGEFPRLNKIMF